MRSYVILLLSYRTSLRLEPRKLRKSEENSLFSLQSHLTPCKLYHQLFCACIDIRKIVFALRKNGLGRPKNFANNWSHVIGEIQTPFFCFLVVFFSLIFEVAVGPRFFFSFEIWAKLRSHPSTSPVELILIEVLNRYCSELGRNSIVQR